MVFYNQQIIRRQDRLLDNSHAIDLLTYGEYGILSMVSTTNTGYGVPLNYVWNGKNSIYIHCAMSGKKLECLHANNSVSFCIVGKTNVLAERFTTEYQSIICCGTIQHVNDDDEKMNALQLLLAKYSPNHRELGNNYVQSSFNRTMVVKLEIDLMTGKSKKL